MKIFKSHFWYNKRQRNGILFLVFLIITLQLVYHFADFNKSDYEVSDVEMEQLQLRIDSIKAIKETKKEFRIYPFNPNFITDFKGYQLGMSVEEIDRLLEFRKTGKYVNSAKQFQVVTQINDSLLAVISPYFKFPNWVNSNAVKKITKKNSSTTQTISTNDLNKVSVKDLQTIQSVDLKLAKRIVSYRKLLHGFSYNNQLYEVYYLDKELANEILKIFKVQQTPKIQKLDINSATFKQIVNLPYIDYELTKKIFEYKNEVKHIFELEELIKIDSFPIDKYDRIALYLTTN